MMSKYLKIFNNTISLLAQVLSFLKLMFNCNPVEMESMIQKLIFCVFSPIHEY